MNITINNGNLTYVKAAPAPAYSKTYTRTVTGASAGTILVRSIDAKSGDTIRITTSLSEKSVASGRIILFYLGSDLAFDMSKKIADPLTLGQEIEFTCPIDVKGIGILPTSDDLGTYSVAIASNTNIFPDFTTSYNHTYTKEISSSSSLAKFNAGLTASAGTAIKVTVAISGKATASGNIKLYYVGENSDFQSSYKIVDPVVLGEEWEFVCPIAITDIGILTNAEDLGTYSVAIIANANIF